VAVNTASPGGRANAFCTPKRQQSMPSSSTGIFRALMEETVSTMESTSGYFFSTWAISGSGDMTPVEVSL